MYFFRSRRVTLALDIALHSPRFACPAVISVGHRNKNNDDNNNNIIKYFYDSMIKCKYRGIRARN